MGIQTCRVTIRDIEGIEHTVEVTASSLYEAVAAGLRAIRTDDWRGEIPEKYTSAVVSVAPVAVQHTVPLAAFREWLERGPTQSPVKIVQWKRAKELLAG